MKKQKIEVDDQEAQEEGQQNVQAGQGDDYQAYLKMMEDVDVKEKERVVKENEEEYEKLRAQT